MEGDWLFVLLVGNSGRRLAVDDVSLLLETGRQKALKGIGEERPALRAFGG